MDLYSVWQNLGALLALVTRGLTMCFHRYSFSPLHHYDIPHTCTSSSPEPCRPPHPATWSGEGTQYTNALIGMLSDDLGWDNTPYLAPDGTLYARLDARLHKAEGGSCIIYDALVNVADEQDRILVAQTHKMRRRHFRCAIICYA
ncbi:hypothetical protein DFH29DRAFT_444462 [Suillus ampliporus]|nr:hypothetical protein DFH29DRAFT_444462 [Suillus ampliporus]